jgi:hypothetical protein
VADRTTIVAGVALVVIALLLAGRTPRRAAETTASRAPAPPPATTAKPRSSIERRESVSPERLLEVGLRAQAKVGTWIGAAVVTCRIPDVPTSNRAAIRYDEAALPDGWFLQSPSPDHHGDVFSFYVPPASGHARLIVEAIGTWDISWPDLVAGEVEPCAAITPRAQTSTVQGTVHARGACEQELVVSGCGTQSDVDDDGSYVLLDVAPGTCELRVQDGHNWSFGPPGCTAPTTIDVALGESVDVDLSIDCDGALTDCQNTWNFCDGTVDFMEMAAMAREQLAHSPPPELEATVRPKLASIFGSTRTLCPSASPAIDRAASDLDIDLSATDSDARMENGHGAQNSGAIRGP